ncbi:hypothetical protein [Sphingomonas sp.]|uniref:hypothetical protein n=1 Tax=Sphingomonas sp. TaxID=28214 RepID=UPI002FD98D81
MSWKPMRAIDWIWHVRGTVPLPAASASLSALEPVFEKRGTTLERSPDMLVFHKDNPDSQDKLASFEHGTLRIVPAENGAELRYDLTSHPLLWCFIAPAPFAALAYAAESMRIPGYSFAGIFAALYIAGRIIEQRQAHRLFRDRLVPVEAASAEPIAA